MSSESNSKFKKLQLSKSSRLKTSAQISNFFSTSNNELLSEFTKSTTQLQDTYNENSKNSWTRNNIVLTISDEEDNVTESYDSSYNNIHIKDKLIKIDDNSNDNLPRKTTISKFFNNSINDDSDFENPRTETKNSKITKTNTIKSKSILKIKKKKQTTIKKAFVRNEEIFSEIMAQHSIAEDVNPDELQMALALSLSEATANGNYPSDDSKESLLLCSEKSNNIRDKLQKFGFKTSSKTEDYDIAYFLPAKKKTKWANKFTALTLRNPEKQKLKLHHKIDQFLADQNNFLIEKNKINDYNKNILVSSIYLKNLKSENVKTEYELESESIKNDSLKMFYVDKLFKPTLAKAGHLMKDLIEIPGRDFSPKKKINKTEKKEICVGDLLKTEDNLLTPQCKKPKVDDILLNSSKDNTDRTSSPDLFADFEMNTPEEKICKYNEREFDSNKSFNIDTNFETNVIIFEKFSSDEVKNSHNISHKIEDNTDYTKIVDDQLIDLTQDLENKSDMHSLQNSTEKIKNDEISYDSQTNYTQSDSIDDCIILSDDEVNYSMSIANNIINDDKNMSSFSDDSIVINKYEENKNFSFINLIEDETDTEKIDNDFNSKNISYIEFLEENDNGDISPVENSLKSQSNINKMGKISQNNTFTSNSSLSEFLSPTKISPTKSIKNLSRMSKYLNSSKKLEFPATVDVTCNKTLQIDSEDDENSFDLTKLRAKFGIKEIDKRKTINRKTLSESYITPKKTHSENNLKLKKFSSNLKFSELIAEDNQYFSDEDEIDKLVHQSEFNCMILNKPSGIDKLISSELNTKPISCNTNSSSNFHMKPKEIISNGRTYLLNTRNISEKPDYKRMDSPTRLKELYKYGLKPLKKKQAVIMLEYIYNQTHPIIINNNSQKSLENYVEESVYAQNNEKDNNEIKQFNSFDLKDCCGFKCVENTFNFQENNDEKFIFQTNISKKISTALLPLHVAWYNLIKSCHILNEAVVHYEPIDLQEIYLFFKSIGYRYHPKDIKNFFDNRCIIFRYDLNQDINTNRHVKKKKLSSLHTNK